MATKHLTLRRRVCSISSLVNMIGEVCVGNDVVFVNNVNIQNIFLNVSC